MRMLPHTRTADTGAATAPGAETGYPGEGHISQGRDADFLESAQSWLMDYVKFTGNLPSGVLGEAIT